MGSIVSNQQNVRPVNAEILPLLSKKLYVVSFAASWLLATLSGLAVYTFTDDEILASLGFSFFSQAVAEFLFLFTCGTAALYTLGVGLAMYYIAWSVIQDRYARTTPAVAIGLCFVPLFNCFWMFQMVWGFAVDCGAYMDRRRVPGRRPTTRLFLACSIIAGPLLLVVLPLIGPGTLLLTWLAAPLFVKKHSQVCDAINAIHQMQMERGPSIP